VSVSGRDIYEQLQMPVVPRKGDILWLSSLTRGHSDVVEVVVSKVEWARDNTAWAARTPHEGIHARLTVRRTKAAKEAERE
jgi:hypothetical protein